jgi:membrane-bound lytic murein transglycosylase D
VPVWDDRPQFTRVELDHAIDVVALSARADIDIATLVALNPGLNGHLTPPAGPHHLLVPAGRSDRVREILPEFRAEDMIVWKTVQVRPGDTLSHLARRHDTSVEALREANGLESDFVRAGQTLRLARAGATPENSPLSERYARLESLQQRLLPRRRFQHQVRPGESLWVIAQRYDVTVSDLRRWNGLGSSSLIRPGERIVVNLDRQGPSGRVRYTVRRGDSLWTIARRHGVSVRDLMQWNGLGEGSILRPGQELVVRGGGNA